MQRTGPFALELPFSSGRVCMRVLLPVMPWVSEDQAISDLLELPDLQERLVEIVLPRLSIDVSTDLVEALTAVGVGVLFSPEAEFRGISDNGVWVSRVKQRTTVTLDEVGAEAAAAMSIHFIIHTVGLHVRGRPPILLDGLRHGNQSSDVSRICGESK